MTDAEPKAQVKNEETDDPVELMLKKTGCIELHYKVQVGSKNVQEMLFSLNSIFFFAGVYC